MRSKGKYGKMRDFNDLGQLLMDGQEKQLFYSPHVLSLILHPLDSPQEKVKG